MAKMVFARMNFKLALILTSILAFSTETEWELGPSQRSRSRSDFPPGWPSRGCSVADELCGFEHPNCCSGFECTVSHRCVPMRPTEAPPVGRCSEEGEACGFWGFRCCEGLECERWRCLGNVRQCSNEGESCGFGDFRCCDGIQCISGVCMIPLKPPSTVRPGHCRSEGETCGFGDFRCCERLWCHRGVCSSGVLRCSREGEYCGDFESFCCHQLLCHEDKCVEYWRLPEMRSYSGKRCGRKGDKCMTQGDCCENKFWCRKNAGEAFGRCEYYL